MKVTKTRDEVKNIIREVLDAIHGYQDDLDPLGSVAYALINGDIPHCKVKMKKKVKTCPHCFFLHVNKACPVCHPE